MSRSEEREALIEYINRVNPGPIFKKAALDRIKKLDSLITSNQDPKQKDIDQKESNFFSRNYITFS